MTHRCGRVRVQSSSMVWPVVFLYPATGHNDFIEQFAEVSTFEEHLQVRPLICCCCYLRCYSHCVLTADHVSRRVTSWCCQTSASRLHGMKPTARTEPPTLKCFTR